MALPHLEGILVGPTASGKTAVAHEIARQRGWGIVSTDAMLVYRGMDIGTAKPTPAERAEVPYIGLDLVNVDAPCSTALWLDRVYEDMGRIGGNFIAAGGTGLYVSALLQGLDGQGESDPNLRAELEAVHGAEGLPGLWKRLDEVAPGRREALADPQNPRRVIRAIERAVLGDERRLWSRDDVRGQVVGLEVPREAWDERFVGRIEAMFAEGLEDEVRSLLAGEAVWSSTAQQAIGYPEVVALLAGEMDREACVERIRSRTRKLAKKQMTWFRNQLGAHWVPGPTAKAEVATVANEVLKKWTEIGTVQLYDRG